MSRIDSSSRLALGPNRRCAASRDFHHGLLGIGGGIGMMYWVFEFGDAAFFFVGTRHGEAKTLLISEVCDRLGIPAELHETSSAKRGAADLNAVLEAGRPAAVWVDMPQLKYLAIPEQAHFGGHVIVVHGIDEATGEVLIADRAARGVRATVAELASARGSKFKPFPPCHKLLDVKPPDEPVSARTLERAVLRGISDCCQQLLHGPIRNIGLEALEKWATLVESEHDSKAWRKVFDKPASLYGALMSAYIFIEIGGTGGSAFRPMFAKFLDEAAEVLGQPELARIACRYRDCAQLWSEVARAALPDGVPQLKRTRELLAEKNRVFEEQASGALKRMQALTAELDEVFAGIGKTKLKDVLPPLATLRPIICSRGIKQLATDGHGFTRIKREHSQTDVASRENGNFPCRSIATSVCRYRLTSRLPIRCPRRCAIACRRVAASWCRSERAS